MVFQSNALREPSLFGLTEQHPSVVRTMLVISFPYVSTTTSMSYILSSPVATSRERPMWRGQDVLDFVNRYARLWRYNSARI